MRRRVAALTWCALVLGAFIAGSSCQAASIPGEKSEGGSRLVGLAATLFPNLTRAERALLNHADVRNVGRGEFAVAGISANPADPSNDPAHADNWDAQRNIRAGLIRWMNVDPDAIRLIDPQGIRVLGARIAGPLDLSQVRVPFAITLRNCSIPATMELSSTEIPSLSLRGSSTGSIHGAAIEVAGVLDLSRGYHSKGVVNLQSAQLGMLHATAGHFEFAPDPQDISEEKYANSARDALNLIYADVRATAAFTFGFEADGRIELYEAKIGADLACDGGKFLNSGAIALDASWASIGGGVSFVSAETDKIVGSKTGRAKINGLLQFVGARVGSYFSVDRATFEGKQGEPHGLSAPGMQVNGFFLWNYVVMQNGAQLDLSGASVTSILDQERSWPAPGNLQINGLTYTGFGGPPFTPGDAETRLRWIGLQPGGYHPQPYRQLAKVLHETGDDAGAVRVLIASGDASFEQYGWQGRVLGWILKVTIGYGHRPLRAIVWSFAVIILGAFIVAIGKRAGVMRLTWPENTPPPTEDPTAEMNPLLYSIDVFVPFVNLHQEHYWWPSAEASGECRVLGWNIHVNGGILRAYLWTQIIAGWLLSAIFIAGVTGLIRSD